MAERGLSRAIGRTARSWGARGLRLLKGFRRLIANVWPSSAAWSAVAAFLAAIAAWLSLTTQQQSTANAIRPELILTGWRSEPLGGRSAMLQFTVSGIRNVGVDPALKIVGYTSHEVAPDVVFGMSVPIVAVGETVEAAGRGMVMWGKGERYRGFRIYVGYSDVSDKRYETVYQMVASKQHISGADRVADGLYSTFRFTTPVAQRWPFAWLGGR
jgi:hypothetical protein